MNDRLLDRVLKIAAATRPGPGRLTETVVRSVARAHQIDPDVLVAHAHSRGWLA